MCYLKYIFILIVVLSACSFFVYQSWFAVSDHLDFPEISFEEADDFGIEEFVDYDIGVRPLPMSSYIRCLFSKNIKNDYSKEDKQHFAMLIDIEKGKKVFQADWIDKKIGTETSIAKSGLSWSIHPFTIQDELVVFFTYQQAESMRSFLLPFLHFPMTF